jgi:threonine aldolase
MKNDLYFELAKHANQQAMKIKNAMKERGVEFLSDTYTNQIFPILSNDLIQNSRKNLNFMSGKRSMKISQRSV